MYKCRSKAQWVGFTVSALAIAIASERLSAADAAAIRERWNEAVKRTRGWAKDE